MNEPENRSTEAVHKARREVFNTLETPEKSDIDNTVLRGQYAGYRGTAGVDNNSQTATYFALKARIAMERWKNVPFFLESGKGLKNKCTEVDVQFKPSPKADDMGLSGNRLQLVLAPENELRIQLHTRASTLPFRLKQVDATMDVSAQKKLPTAYEKIIHDALAGERLVFADNQEVESAWEFLMPVLKAKTPIHTYPVGSHGPDLRRKILP
jgi:glucose-6-phosphate 1-dehydrogenase